MEVMPTPKAMLASIRQAREHLASGVEMLNRCEDSISLGLATMDSGVQRVVVVRQLAVVAAGQFRLATLYADRLSEAALALVGPDGLSQSGR